MTTPSEVQSILRSLDKNQSLLDPSRPTVGKTYRDLQINSSHTPILIGDMSHELTKSLVDDINEALLLPSENDEPFFLLISEKKDLQLKQAIYRMRKHLSYRPYPEDNTLVFWKNPKTQEVRFCWDLPHWAEMDLILANMNEYDIKYISHIKSWKKNDLTPFGFVYTKKLKWVPDPLWRDKTIPSS